MELKDKVPPHNLDAEQATLGAILFDSSVISEIATILRSDRFYSFQNQLSQYHYYLLSYFPHDRDGAGSIWS